MRLLVVVALSRLSGFVLSLNSNPLVTVSGEHKLTISHQKSVTTIPINSSETILQAMERFKANNKLSIPSLPHDCRRGNCLTCSAIVGSDTLSSVQVRNDGLAPSIKKKLLESRMIPTCSAYVTGDVLVEIGASDEVWRKVWQDEDEGVSVRRESSAKAIRLNDERNISQWKMKTGKMLKS